MSKIYYRVKLAYSEGWKYFRTWEAAREYGEPEEITYEDEVEIEMIETVLTHDEKTADLEKEWLEKHKKT